MKTDYDQTYAARNRLKVRRCFHTYDAMWRAAGTLAGRLYPDLKGRHGASTIVHVALAQFLERHGSKVPSFIKEIKGLDVCRSSCG
jgi:hypothetical protein